MNLSQLQSSLQKAIVDFDPKSLAKMPIRSDADFAREERVEIYHDDWWCRLFDLMSSDFPALKAHMGEDAFADLISDYVRQRPSRSFTVFALGSQLAEFMSSRGESKERCGIAQVEYDLIRVRLAKNPNEWSQSDLQALSPEAWEQLTFTIEPGFELRQVIWEGVYGPHLIYRPRHKPKVERISDSFFALLSALKCRESVTLEEFGSLASDVQTHLTQCLTYKVLTPMLRSPDQITQTLWV